MSHPTYPDRGGQGTCRRMEPAFPPHHQNRQPGAEYHMDPLPAAKGPCVRGGGKLKGKTALITGGDSAIGRAVAYAFAKEGANVAISCFGGERDARETQAHIEALGVPCILLPADLRDRRGAKRIVKETVELFGQIDVLVNNHGIQFVCENILAITPDQLENTVDPNVCGFFYVIEEALPDIPQGGAIIHAVSATACQGSGKLLDSSATRAAIVSLTRSLAQSLAGRKIRVNAVAPGPAWAPFQPTASPAGQPLEMVQSCLYLACDDSAGITGQVLQIDGGSCGYS